MKFAKPSTKEIIIVMVLLSIPVFALTASAQYSVIDSPGGDEYYEYRCIDVSSYLTQGYSVYSTDEYGCDLVRKKIYLALTRIDIDCENRLKNQWCETRLGSSFKYAGYCEHPPRNSISRLVCGIPSYVYAGGYEQVVNTCYYEPNDLLAAETFDGGSRIDKFDLRYPVKGFCLAHPAIYTDTNSLTSQTSTTVYEDLDSGDMITVPESQTLTIFYIMENNDNLPTICNSGDNLALNLDTNETCSSTLGFTYLCSEGQFDALTGTCVVQPESSIICEVGRYDVLSGQCIYNPPLQVDCGRIDAYYSVTRDACIYNPETIHVCPEGFEFEEPITLEECDAINGFWDICPQCPEGQVCSQEICKATCSKGQVCVWDEPDFSVCEENNATIDDSGYCILEDGSKYYVCGEELKYDEERKVCIGIPESTLTCGDDRYPVYNSQTNNEECVIKEMTFKSCPAGTVFNLNKCVSRVAVYNDATGELEYLTADELKDYYWSEFKDYLRKDKVQNYLFASMFIIVFLYLLYLLFIKKK